LNNSSRLAGFARHADLPFFLAELCGAEYLHVPRLAPTRGMLDAYRKGSVGWPGYEERFLELMRARRVEEALDRSLFGTLTVLLCSEAGPERCHRHLGPGVPGSGMGRHPDRSPVGGTCGSS
jgi:hypothetical protein